MSPRDEDDELIAKLKALPPEGQEPDWQKLEAAIRAQVGDRAPVVWWRNWKWIVPMWALATTAAVALNLQAQLFQILCRHRQAEATVARALNGVRDQRRHLAHPHRPGRLRRRSVLPVHRPQMGHQQRRRPHPTVHQRRLATTRSQPLLNSYHLTC